MQIIIYHIDTMTLNKSKNMKWLTILFPQGMAIIIDWAVNQEMGMII